MSLAKQVLLKNGFTSEDLENAKITLRTGGGKERRNTKYRYRPPVVIRKKSQFSDRWITSQNSWYEIKRWMALVPEAMLAEDQRVGTTHTNLFLTFRFPN